VIFHSLDKREKAFTVFILEVLGRGAITIAAVAARYQTTHGEVREQAAAAADMQPTVLLGPVMEMDRKGTAAARAALAVQSDNPICKRFTSVVVAAAEWTMTGLMATSLHGEEVLAVE